MATPLLLLAAVAAAASLEGKVTLEKAPVGGALVRARGVDGPTVFITRTDAHGQYALKDLGAGAYVLEVDVEGQLAFRSRIEVREPATRRDIALVTSENVPYVNIQIVKAVDDAVVTINDIQVLRWGVDSGEMRKFALTQPRNTFEVIVTSKASVKSGFQLFGSRSAAGWQYRVVIRSSDGEQWEFEDAQEVAAGTDKRFPVLRGTLVLDGTTRKVRLVDVDRELWRKTAPSRRLPSIQF